MKAQRTVSMDNAYVGADVAQIEFPGVSGPIAFQVTVDNTRPVHKGDVLVVIDASDARLAVAQAVEADYPQHTAAGERYYAQQRAAAAATVEANGSATSPVPADDYARRQRLVAQSGAIERRGAVDSSRTDARKLWVVANLAAAREALKAQEEMVKGVKDVATHPETIAAKAALDKAQLDLSTHRDPRAHRRNRRPAQGAGGTKRAARPGPDDRDPHRPGLMSMPPLQGRPTRACPYRPAGRTHIRPVWRPKSSYHGHVTGLGGGTGSGFCGDPGAKCTGVTGSRWSSAVPVRITLDPKELAAHPLRVGLSMTATIDTGKGN